MSIRNIGWLPRFLEVVFGNAGANRYLWRVEIKQQQHKPMKATYLGLELDSPIVVSSSPYTATLANIEKCAAAGAGAVVLKSIFEEQILHHAASLEQYSDSPYGDAGDYLQRYLGEDYKAGFLQLIADARRATRIPVIASINCVAAGEEWIEYAAAMARAGASALELNIFIQPVDAARSSQELERLYVTIAQRVCAEVKIPVSVKLAMRFTNVVAMAAALESVGVKGAVLFNRFFEPDVDVERMTFVGVAQRIAHDGDLRRCAAAYGFRRFDGRARRRGGGQGASLRCCGRRGLHGDPPRRFRRDRAHE